MDDYGEDGWEEEPPRSPQIVPQLEEKDDELVLQDCLEPFKNKDYVMEPEIFTSIKRFFQAGGETESLIDLLADNYIGTAQSANLLANWLIFTGADVHDVEQIVEDHLKTLIVQNFDVKKADSIFTEEGGTPPWLEQMIQHPTWRSMIYKLAEQYPDCLMLNFTIKLISDVGYQDEIARVSSACHQIDVFSRVLKTSIGTFQELAETSGSRTSPFPRLFFKSRNSIFSKFCPVACETIAKKIASLKCPQDINRC